MEEYIQSLTRILSVRHGKCACRDESILPFGVCLSQLGVLFSSYSSLDFFLKEVGDVINC